MEHTAQHLVDEEKDEIGVVVVGKIGVGKSSLCNKLVGDSVFGEGDGLAAVTQDCTMRFVQKRFAKTENIKIIDTPGYLDTEKAADKINHTILQFLSKGQGIADIILVVFALSEEIEEDEIVDIENNLKEMFNNKVHNHIINVFTHANDMIKVCGENTFSAYVKKMPHQLSLYLTSCDNRWIVLDNTSAKDQEYREIVQMIVDVQSRNKSENNELSLKDVHLRAIVREKQKEINRLQSKENSEIKRLKEENLAKSKTIKDLEDSIENLRKIIDRSNEEKEPDGGARRRSISWLLYIKTIEPKYKFWEEKVHETFHEKETAVKLTLLTCVQFTVATF